MQDKDNRAIYQKILPKSNNIGNITRVSIHRSDGYPPMMLRHRHGTVLARSAMYVRPDYRI